MPCQAAHIQDVNIWGLIVSPINELMPLTTIHYQLLATCTCIVIKSLEELNVLL